MGLRAYSNVGTEPRKRIAACCSLPRRREQMLPFHKETSGGIPGGQRSKVSITDALESWVLLGSGLGSLNIQNQHKGV